MEYRTILVTGGAGFVGSHICIGLKQYYRDIKVIAIDNLKRRGSELNLSRLAECGVEFIHGDIRKRTDLEFKNIDLLIECSAEPSVMAGVTSSPEYLIDTDLSGAINCFELARKNEADIVFLSTSRVYPIAKLNELRYEETDTRFKLLANQPVEGASIEGISEKFPLEGTRSIYGATKLSAEIILQEYIDNYGIRGVINRCGLLTGPWQFGKVDQGVVVFWLARHIFKKPLHYIGFGGKGKQVRDMLNVDDLFELLRLQIEDMSKFNKQVYNIGGGKKNSFSLLELTEYCQQITGSKIKIDSKSETRVGDVRIYISDNRKLYWKTDWRPKENLEKTLNKIYEWIVKNKKKLAYVFG